MRNVFIFFMCLYAQGLLGQIDQNAIVELNQVDLSEGKSVVMDRIRVIEGHAADSLNTIFKVGFSDDPVDFPGEYVALSLIGSSDHQKVMVIFNANIDQLLAVKYTNKGVSYHRTGTTIDPQDAAFRMSFVNGLPVEIAAGEEVRILLKFPQIEGQRPWMEIKDFEQIDEKISGRLRVSYVFTSILLTFAIYNLMLAFLVKRRVYFFYSYYIFSFALYASLITLTLIFSRSVVAPLSIVSAATMISVGALFSGEFLRIQKHLKSAVFYYKFLKYFVIGVVLLLLSNVVLWQNFYLNNILAISAALIGLSSVLFWLWVGYRIQRRGNPRGRLFLLTNIPLLIGCCAFIVFWLLNHLNIIAASSHLAWVASLVLFGSVLFQLFLFSFVIGYRINRLQFEKLQIQQDINQALEVQVAERTASLTSANASIEEQKEQLAALNQVKDSLFSIVSHDLRNPLNSVKGVLELIKNNSLQGDDLQLVAKKLEGSLDSTLNLLDNLLYWAKSQMDGIQPEPRMIQPKTIIENNLRLALILFKEKDLNVITDLNDDQAFADEDMIDLVVRNLLSNAIKFTPAKGEISLKMGSRNGFLKFSFEDTGIGMSPKVLNELFSTEKTHTSYGTNNEKGYGLGLKLCKDFIEVNGGRLMIESVENKGSIFTVILPSS